MSNDASPPPPPTGEAIPVSPDRLRGHVQHLAASPRNGRYAPTGHLAARQYATDHLTAAGWTVREQPVEVQHRVGVTDAKGPRPVWPLAYYRKLTGTNLVAERGTTTGPALLIGAHLDSVKDSPGADDNASGVAVLLELATVLTEMNLAKRVILAALDLEETGHQGAEVLAAELGDQLVGMVCLESVGYYSDDPGSQKLPRRAQFLMKESARQLRANENRGDFAMIVHRTSSTWMAQRWAQAVAATATPLQTMTVHDPRSTGLRGRLLTTLLPVLSNLDRSDHAQFWNVGVPAIAITDTAVLRNPHYHRPTDTPDTLDYTRLAAVTTATATLAISADSATERIDEAVQWHR